MPDASHGQDRLAYRPAEAAHACGVSRATFYDWMSRGLAPRPIQTPGGGATLILASTLKLWLEESQKAGRLLTRDEFDAITAHDPAGAPVIHQKRGTE